jgi:hypothetical protein
MDSGLLHLSDSISQSRPPKDTKKYQIQKKSKQAATAILSLNGLTAVIGALKKLGDKVNCQAINCTSKYPYPGRVQESLEKRKRRKKC